MSGGDTRRRNTAGAYETRAKSAHRTALLGEDRPFGCDDRGFDIDQKAVLPICMSVGGAIWSPFNKASLMRLEVDEGACTQCGACKNVCPVELEVYRDPNSDACIRCLECTRCDAVSVSWSRKSTSAGKACVGGL